MKFRKYKSPITEEIICEAIIPYTEGSFWDAKIFSEHNWAFLFLSIASYSINRIFQIFKSAFTLYEFKYAFKCLSYIFHRFVGLQAQRMADIYDTDGQTVIDQKNIWVDIDSDFAWCDPYYICALFSNGKHLPLPLVLESNGDYWMQNIILSAMRHCGLLNSAKKACLNYKQAWND